jgi:hypothetical protein
LVWWAIWFDAEILVKFHNFAHPTIIWLGGQFGLMPKLWLNPIILPTLRLFGLVGNLV